MDSRYYTLDYINNNFDINNDVVKRLIIKKQLKGCFIKGDIQYVPRDAFNDYYYIINNPKYMRIAVLKRFKTLNKRNISLTQMAKETGLSASLLSKIKNGYDDFTYTTLFKLCDNYNGGLQCKLSTLVKIAKESELEDKENKSLIPGEGVKISERVIAKPKVEDIHKANEFSSKNKEHVEDENKSDKALESFDDEDIYELTYSISDDLDTTKEYIEDLKEEVNNLRNEIKILQDTKKDKFFKKLFKRRGA